MNKNVLKRKQKYYASTDNNLINFTKTIFTVLVGNIAASSTNAQIVNTIEQPTQPLPTTLSASNTANTDASETKKTCTDWNYLFESLNYYFRKDDILPGSEHSALGVSIIFIKLLPKNITEK